MCKPPAWFRRFNDLPIFDASRWPARDLLTKILASLVIGAFVVKRILKLPNFPGVIPEVREIAAGFAKLSFLPPSWVARPYDLEKYYAAFGYSHGEIVALWSLQLSVWLIETGILVGYIVAFLTREKAKSPAKGFLETVFPVAVGIFPFLIIMTDYTYRRWMPMHADAHMAGLYALNAVLILSGGFNLISLFTLRRAFTIMSEARLFIRAGAYRWIRHPLYAAHFVTYFCCMLLHFQALTVALYLAFLIAQTLRARIEERKLSAAFPEYEEYRRRTGMFFPKFQKPESLRGITS